MRKPLQSLAIICLFCLAGALPAHADMQAGMMAYEKKNYAAAMREFKRAGHNPQASYLLARMYFQGQGVAQDKKEAAKWLRLAAEQGHVAAQLILGGMYITGEGGEQDPREGVKWIRASAGKGYAEAQFRLGVMHVNGDQVPKDRKKGVELLKKAVRQRHQNAVKLLKVMGEAVPAPKK